MGLNGDSVAENDLALYTCTITSCVRIVTWCWAHQKVAALTKYWPAKQSHKLANKKKAQHEKPGVSWWRCGSRLFIFSEASNEGGREESRVRRKGPGRVVELSYWSPLLPHLFLPTLGQPKAQLTVNVVGQIFHHRPRLARLDVENHLCDGEVTKGKTRSRVSDFTCSIFPIERSTRSSATHPFVFLLLVHVLDGVLKVFHRQLQGNKRKCFHFKASDSGK